MHRGRESVDCLEGLSLILSGAVWFEGGPWPKGVHVKGMVRRGAGRGTALPVPCVRRGGTAAVWRGAFPGRGSRGGCSRVRAAPSHGSEGSTTTTGGGRRPSSTSGGPFTLGCTSRTSRPRASTTGRASASAARTRSSTFRGTTTLGSRRGGWTSSGRDSTSGGRRRGLPPQPPPPNPWCPPPRPRGPPHFWARPGRIPGEGRGILQRGGRCFRRR